MELPIRPVILNNIKLEPPAATKLVYQTESISNMSNMNNMSNNSTKVESKNLKRPIGNMTFNSSVPAIDLGKLLLIACRDGNLTKTYELISKGAPFASDWLGMSALHFAAQNNHLKICELLLRGGHNLDLKTKVERTPLHLAAYEGHEKVVELLCMKKADPNITDMLRMTPLHWAIEKRHKKIVHMLLRYGANVDDISKFGKSPFDLAIQTGQHELITHLNHAKENQTEREMLITEQIENETTRAVNSITMTTDDNMICDDEEETIENQNDETVEELSNEDDKSTMEMLKNLKSMAQSKDNLIENDNLLSSALQNGRKLILSEGGKLALNETRKKQLSESNINNLLNIKQEQKQQPNKIVFDKLNENIKEKNNSIELKPIINRHGKGVQVISLETFKKLYGNTTAKQLNSFRKKPTLPQLSNITKITNLNEITSNRAFFQSKNSNVQTFNIHKLKEIPEISNNEEIKLMPNMIDIKTDDIIEDESEILNETENIFVNINNDPIINEIPIMDVPSICKELYELRKLVGSLKQELEVTKQENQQYKIRIEHIERLMQGD